MDKSQSEKEYVKAALEYRDIMQKAIDRRSRGVVVDPVSGKERPATAASAPAAAGNSSGNWVLKPGADKRFRSSWVTEAIMARSVPWEIDDTLITPEVLDAVKHVESRGNPNAVSPAGAVGPYQFMPATARRFGLSDPRHEPSARDAAARYLSQLAERYGGDVDKALLAYKWARGTLTRTSKAGAV